MRLLDFHSSVMVSRVPELLTNLSGTTHGIVAIAAIVFLILRSRRPKLDAIPTVGSNSWLQSVWAGLTYYQNASSVVQEGWDKHKSNPFKVAQFFRWNVVITDQGAVEEVLRAPEDTFSAWEARNDVTGLNYTFPQEMHENKYHIAIMRSQLTQKIGELHPVMRDELVAAFDEVLDLECNEWKPITALNAAEKIVCRTNNRLFVGLPLCRHPDWIDLNIYFTIDSFKTGALIGLCPVFLRPLAAFLFSGTKRQTRRCMKHLDPIIEERLRNLNEHGKEMPNDFLSWLIQEAKGVRSTIESLSIRILGVNFASIETTVVTFTHALFYLAENPQYIEPLREEVDAIVEEEGWTKTAVARMHKIDSFLKESQRMTSPFLHLERKAMKDCTLSDGTFIPKGTLVSIATRAIHRDDKIFENPDKFEPFRFVDNENGESSKRRFGSVGIDSLSFGYGRNACPGRFFATNVLKSMMAHVITTYDIKLGDDVASPHSLYIGTFDIPNPQRHVLFRRRIDRDQVCMAQSD